MSANSIEGGEYHCYIHDFITSDNEDWYKHMEAKENKHTEEGSGQCLFCHNDVEFKGLPWTRPGTVKGVVCDSCKESQLRSLV